MDLMKKSNKEYQKLKSQSKSLRVRIEKKFKVKWNTKTKKWNPPKKQWKMPAAMKKMLKKRKNIKKTMVKTLKKNKKY